MIVMIFLLSLFGVSTDYEVSLVEQSIYTQVFFFYHNNCSIITVAIYLIEEFRALLESVR